MNKWQHSGALVYKTTSTKLPKNTAEILIAMINGSREPATITKAASDLVVLLNSMEAAPQPDEQESDPMISAMGDVADTFAHKLALDLECVLADYSGKWYDTAIKTIGAYRSAMNAIHEKQSPTFMGEPQVNINGLTRKEESNTDSVMGIVGPTVWNSIQIASWIGSQLMHEPSMFERSTVVKFVRSLGRHPTLLKHSPEAGLKLMSIDQGAKP